jgi:hypothetical protein
MAVQWRSELPADFFKGADEYFLLPGILLQKESAFVFELLLRYVRAEHLSEKVIGYRLEGCLVIISRFFRGIVLSKIFLRRWEYCIFAFFLGKFQLVEPAD